VAEEEEKIEVIKDVPKEEEEEKKVPVKEFDKEGWKPKTGLGEKVKSGEINDIDMVLDNGIKILENEIVDILLPGLETDLLLIGQAKGKFGGGKRRVFKQTQKKTREGNKPKFSTIAIIGNKNGYVGIGFGKSKETVPAREKSIRNAKLNIFKIRRGCGSWQCGCKEPHTIPFMVEGKSGSSIIKLMPAPKGTGLKVEKECAKVLNLAGIKDVWSKTYGQTTKFNLIDACIKALKRLIETKVKTTDAGNLGVVEGKIEEEVKENE
jgi:small subunit ribosomal protein S5